ncbi:hypothetical protein AVEN_155023-1 [Araneus ventricosus]|uniref:Cuticle protein 10.9 n=1 Tax=Araneus ventricosus TaxID=182803 RepID=A0A4Y2A8G8_ARAVE|nr:hypothetical protein AVEN_155023-1 [Araneus ventricosus]
MLQICLPFTYMIAYFLLRTAAQEIPNGYIPATNESAGKNVPLFSIDEGQSDIWLLTKDSPIPARLNRAWSPETGYPGVQHVSTLRRSSYGQLSRGPQSPIDVLESRNENTQGNEDLFVYVPDSRLENSYHNPEAVLVQLPAELTSGFWESPRPQFMEQLTANGRSGSTHPLDLIQFDDGNSDNRPQTTSESVLPTTEAADRLSVSTFGPQNENNPAEPIHELSQHPFFIASGGFINGTVSPISESPSNQQDAWLTTQGRDASTSPIAVSGNGRELFYEVAYDELPSTSSSGSFGLTLTKDDIEILEKLGILSALNLESSEFQNKTDAREKSPQKEQTRPQLIEQGNQHLTAVSGGKYDTNFTDVVFIDVPEFLTSEYHGNIPGTDEERVPTKPIPFILSDTSLPKGNESEINENSTDTYVYNASSLTSEQIEQIFELLGISDQSNDNHSSSQSTAAEIDAVTTPVSEAEGATSNLKVQLTTESPVIISFGNGSDIKTSMSTSISRSFLAVPGNSSTNGEKPKHSQGLVSSGRIQPRLLDSNRSAKENEVLQMISRRMSPISVQKLEILKKLKIKPRPYVFGFKQDDGNGTHQHRNETADGSGVVKGTYGYRDAFGVYRNVNYIADNNGFHAVVRTNEPGTISTSTADAVYKAELPPQAAVAQMMAYAKARVKKVNSS